MCFLILNPIPIPNHNSKVEFKSFRVVCSTMHAIVIWQKETKITYKRFSTILSYEYADRIGKEKGYGETVLIRFSLPFKNRILKAVRDFFAGIKYRYPACCIISFAVDTVLDRPSAQLRYSDKTDYVECFAHIRRRDKTIIPLDVY
jgi:hypothetical protein